MLAAQRVDAEALAADAEARGWIDEADRHRRLIARLDALLAEAKRGDFSRRPSPGSSGRAPNWSVTPEPVSFTNVAERAQISRTTLYRDENLRAVVEEHRSAQPRSAEPLRASSPRSVTCEPPSRLSPNVSEATKNSCAGSVASRKAN